MGVKLGLRVFDNRALKRILTSKRAVTGDWKKLLNEELRKHIKMIKPIKMRWAGNVASMGEEACIFQK
jgi:hypothetical protein